MTKISSSHGTLRLCLMVALSCALSSLVQTSGAQGPLLVSKASVDDKLPALPIMDVEVPDAASATSTTHASGGGRKMRQVSGTTEVHLPTYNYKVSRLDNGMDYIKKPVARRYGIPKLS